MERITAATPIHVHVSSPLQRKSYRIESIDLLRGLVMIIMALDHTRDFFHVQANIADPLDLAITTPFLFFTRWITHFCAPVFVFLTGASAYFQSLRKTKKELSLFLIKRGLWLILLEATLISFAWSFDIHYSFFILQVIWAIGISMVLLGLAIMLPFAAVLTIGLVIVLGHNSLDFYEAHLKSSPGFLYDLIHRQNSYPLWGQHSLMIFYPFMAWTGLMFLGYCFGKVFINTDPAKRMKVLTMWGGGLILFFVALRATNTYGDPSHWAVQKNATFTFLSFIKVQKYPPSLLYMCATIGPALLFLAWVGNAGSRLAKVITVYGRVPFLYYVAHIYLIHLAVTAVFFARGHSLSEGINGASHTPFNFVVSGEGFNLGIVYLIWLLMVAALYPLCKKYSEYKLTHKQWWLSYL
jgi:uncharacterized membrane protein